MKNILFNEWKKLVRIPLLVYLFIGFVIVLGIVSYLGIQETKLQRTQQERVQQNLRKQWENLDQINVHRVAHFGTYVVKPPTVLSSIDEGINSNVGTTVRLEAHVQNEAAYSESSQSLFISKFGKLKPSVLLQYIIPLFIIFLTFASISEERETGRLKLLVLQGISIRKLIFAKTLSVWCCALLLLIITLGVGLVVNETNNSPDFLLRLGLIFVVYALYYYIIAILSTWLSARLKHKTSSLSSMLTIWIVWTIFMPKIWGNASENIYPLPSRQDFQKAMQIDRAKGLDGHNPSDKRADQLDKTILSQYNVSSIDDLPINYDGIRMQADEEYGNSVWDKHFGRRNTIFHQQKRFYQALGLVNPFMSLQNTSMGFCGSDLYHHLNFLRQAEDYRREFIKMLNEQQTHGGSKTGDWSWTDNSDFYQSITDFHYQPMSLYSANSFYRIDLFILIFWSLLITFIVALRAKKISVI